jgi:transposase
MEKQRRRFTGTEKVALIKKHLVDHVAVSKLCEDHDLHASQFYLWLKEFFENGHRAFDSDRKAKADENAKDHKIQQLEAKLQRKDSVLAELMEEHISLKKELGEI